MHPIRRAAHVVLLSGLAIGLSGCGGSTPASTSGSATTTIASGASSSASSAAPSSPASATTPAGPSACRTSDLKVTVSPGEGAAGSTYYTVVLTNPSGATCRTGGYGGVSLVNGPTGHPIGAPAVRTAKDKVTAISLRPGGRAAATLQVSSADNYSPARCTPTSAAGFRIYPPNETRSAFVKTPVPACRNAKVHLLTLSPYQPQ